MTVLLYKKLTQYPEEWELVPGQSALVHASGLVLLGRTNLTWTVHTALGQPSLRSLNPTSPVRIAAVKLYGELRKVVESKALVKANATIDAMLEPPAKAVEAAPWAPGSVFERSGGTFSGRTSVQFWQGWRLFDPTPNKWSGITWRSSQEAQQALETHDLRGISAIKRNR